MKKFQSLGFTQWIKIIKSEFKHNMEKLAVSSDYDFNHLEFKELMLAYFYETAFTTQIKKFPESLDQFKILFMGLRTFF